MSPRSSDDHRIICLLTLLLLRPKPAFAGQPDVARPRGPMDDAILLARLTPEQRALVERWTPRSPEAAMKEQFQRVKEEIKAQAAAAGTITAAAATAGGLTEGVDQAAYDAEHAALLAIKAAAGDNFMLSSWEANTNHCTEWGPAIACDAAGRVSKLIMTWYDAPLPNRQLEVLSKLQHLEVMVNVDATEQALLPPTWPAAFPELSFLVAIGIGSGGVNSLPNKPASIPSTRRDWKVLQHLFLNGVKLSASLESVLAVLPPNLQTLYLSGGQITGTLPAGLSDMTSLVTLSLSFNQLAGTVTGLERLVNLTNLQLSWNNFSGGLPTLPSSIVEASFAVNNFTGGLPDSYTSLPNLKSLTVASNPLGGVVPAAYSSLTTLEYFAADSCGLTGIEPGLVLPNCATLSLSGNSIETLPSSFEGWSRLSLLDVSRNKIGGRIPAALQNLPSAFFINLSWNRLTGFLPDWTWNLFGQYATVDLSHNCLSSDKPIPCLDASRLPPRLSVCFNPVSPEVCGASAGNLSGCVSPQIGGADVEFDDYEGALFCAGSYSWREGTGLQYCSIQAYSKARADSPTCVQQLNSPLDPACSSSRNSTAAQPWGFFNQGPSSSSVMRVPLEGKNWWDTETSWCSISRGVGYASASCSVNSRGQQRITFNLTTANADNITKRLYWTGCQPPKAPADAAAPGPQTTARPCNKWAAVPINAKKVRVSAAYTSTTWTVNLPKRSCSCDQAYWSLFAKSDTVCNAGSP